MRNILHLTWAQDYRSGPEPRAAGPGLGTGPDRTWDRAQGSPGPGAAAGGLGSCKVYEGMWYEKTRECICIHMFVVISCSLLSF